MVAVAGGMLAGVNTLQKWGCVAPRTQSQGVTLPNPCGGERSLVVAIITDFIIIIILNLDKVSIDFIN